MGSDEFMMMDDRLKMYIISCHADKPLEEEPPASIYDCPIQAGAALTDQRTCMINDHDGFPESISDRNRRYSEATAMWWIGKHIDTPYVGIAHYRRRLKLTDGELATLMDQGVDIITMIRKDLGMSIEADYRSVLYSRDWDLFMRILKEKAPQDAAFAEKCFSSTQMHVCNLNVFKSELYEEYCRWAFPIMDAFYHQSPEKTDVYQRRDVGFISERLTSLFVMKMEAIGKNVVEAELLQFKSTGWQAENECDLDDREDVYKACDRLYRARQIMKCGNLLAKVWERGVVTDDDRLCLLMDVLLAAQSERKHLTKTMYEYLPEELRTDLDTLLRIYEGFRKAVRLYFTIGGEQGLKILENYLQLTRFSRIAAIKAGQSEHIEDGEIQKMIELPVWTA